MTRIKTAGWVMHKCSLDSYKFWTHYLSWYQLQWLSWTMPRSERSPRRGCPPSASTFSALLSFYFLMFDCKKQPFLLQRKKKQVTSLSCWSNKPLLYFLFLKIINRGNGEPQETRNINDKMLSLSSIIKNKYELYKGRFQVKGRRDSGTKQKREIDQTFHLCGLRNKTSLFALQSHSNFQKLANTMFNDKVSLLTQLSNVLEQNIY